MSNNVPCLGCRIRHICCHATCQSYLDFKSINEEIAATRREYKDSISNIARTGIKRAKVY